MNTVAEQMAAEYGMTVRDFLEVNRLTPRDVIARRLTDLDIYAPRKGDPVSYMGRRVGTVTRVEGNICHIEDLPYLPDPTGGLFIWRHRENNETETPAMLNRMWSWPGKERAE